MATKVFMVTMLIRNVVWARVKDEDRNQGDTCKDIYILATKKASNATTNGITQKSMA